MNGVTSYATDSQGHALVKPGDLVTYELTYTLPHSDIVDYSLSDYLPLPVFNTSMAPNNSLTHVSTVSATLAAPGTWAFGSNDTFNAKSGIVPTVTDNTTANSFTFTYGDYKDPANQPSESDILFTVQATDAKFSDGLFLTNQGSEDEGSETGGTQHLDAIVMIKMEEPNLSITKGVVSTSDKNGVFSPGTVAPVSFNAPGTSGTGFTGTIDSTGLASHPIDSNLSNVQASDLVRFAVAVQNKGTGPGGAFNVTLNDTIPTGFQIPAGGLHFSITDGAGNVLAYTKPDGSAATPADFFTSGGIELVDPSSTQGSLAAYSPSSGANVVIITYDLQAEGTTGANPVQPLENLKNTAEITNYASEPNGPTFTPTPLSNSSTVTIAAPTTTKTLATENVPSVTGPGNVVIGEVVTYTVTVTVPQGVTNNAVVTDTLPAGLGFIDGTAASATSGVSFTGSGSASDVGQVITFTLGTITDSNTTTDGSNHDTISFTYRAIVLNVTSNKAGVTLTNNAVLTYKDGNGNPETENAAKASTTIVEPKVNINKTVKVNGVAGGTGDAGDPVVYTIVLNHDDTTPNAYDLNLTDPIPGLILNPTITSVVDSASLVGASNFSLSGNSLTTATEFNMPTGSNRTITITISGTLTSTLTPGQEIDNTADVKYDDLGRPVTATSPNDVADSTFRTTDGQSTAKFYVNPATPTKSLITTSESSTTGNNVAVGEIVRYRLAVRIPQSSTLPSFQLADLLPAGMSFLNDGTADVAFVTPTSGGQIQSTGSVGLSGAGLNFTGNYTSASQLSGITPTVALPAGNISVAANGSPTFSLGDLNNTARDLNYESFAIVDFNALVDNVGGNVDGTKLDNSFKVLSGGSYLNNGNASNTVEVDVVEPKLSLVKSVVTSAPFQAGTNVTYQVVLTNTGDATAFNVALNDLLPSYESTISNQIVVGSTPPGVTVNFASTNSGITDSINQLAVGQSLTVQFTTQLQQNVTPALTVTNTAQSNWTSLPGTNGTTGNGTGSNTPGTPGSSTGERTGPLSSSDNVNTYTVSGSAPLSIAIPSNLTKTAVSGSVSQVTLPSVVVGENVTYDMTFTLSAATYSAGLSLSDLLPSSGVSMTYVSSKVDAIGAAISGSALSIGGSGTGSGASATFNFGSGVVVAPNVSGSSAYQITVEVTAHVDNVAANKDGATLTNNATLNYGSGTLTASAKVNVVEPKLQIVKSASVAKGDAGDLVTYTVVVSHAVGSDAPAFDVNVSDLLVPGAVLKVGSVTTSQGTVIKGDTAGDTSVAISDSLLPVGQSITITYQATLPKTAAPGSTVTNTASLAYDHGPSTRPDSGSATANVVINTNDISGFVFLDHSKAGDYSSLTNLPGVTITLTGTDYLGNTVSIPVATNSSGYYDIPNLRPGNYVLTETQPPYYPGKDVPGSVFGGASAPGSSTVIQSIVIPPESNTSGPNYDFYVRLAADIGVTKTIDNSHPQIGANVTFTVTATNHGPNAATGVAITDQLPSGLTYVSDSAAGAYNHTTGVWAIGNLANGASTSFTITAKVVSGTLQTNTATVSASDQYDYNSSNNSASASETPEADLIIKKTETTAAPVVGYTIGYTVSVTNSGPGISTDAVVNDPLPAGLSFISATPSVGTYNSTTGVWTIGTIAVGATPTLQITARVISTSAQTNTATVTEDQYNGNPNKASVTETPVLCSGQLLDAATGFNLFAFSDVNLNNTDVAGRVAVGGNGTFSNVGIATGLTNSNGTVDELIDNGNLTDSNGTVANGNVVYGISKNLSHVSVPNGTVRKQLNDIDFTAVQINQDAKSTYLSTLLQNGTTTNQYGILTLAGTDPTLDVFNISGTTLGTTNTVNITAPANATVVINVSGTADAFQGMGININGTTNQHVVWNFYQATSVAIYNIAVEGSVLAPLAYVQFNNGNVDGTLVANVVTGNGEFHNFPSLIPCVADKILAGPTGVSVSGGVTQETVSWRLWLVR